MKKSFIIGIIVIITGDARAAPNCCATACINAPVGATITYDASCTDSNVCNCTGTTETALSGGVIEIRTKTKKQMCSASYVASARCMTDTTYKCAVGYYGSPSIFNKTCTRCPAFGDVYGTTASAGAAANTNCYLPAQTTGTDTSGTYTYTSDCYYSL